jgi:signal transduction histidine kinase
LARKWIWSAYALVILLAGIGVWQMCLRHFDADLAAMRERATERAKQVEALLISVTNHVNMLRISANEGLNDFGEGVGHNTSPLFHHVKPSSNFAGYCSERDGHTHARSAPALSGLGSLPAPGSMLYRETNMALMLNPQFAATAENISNMAWAYYVSAAHFVVLYPFVDCAEFHYSDDLLQHEFFTLGTPVLNPSRATFWTKAYDDEAGKGLMATVGAPVYEGSRFLGTVAIDLTLNALSRYVRGTGLDGVAFIVNKDGQVLAHPTLMPENATTAPPIAAAFGPEIANPERFVTWGTGGKFVAIGDKLIYATHLSTSPWNLVYVADQSTHMLNAFAESYIEIALFLVLVLLILAFERSRLAAAALNLHVAELQEAGKALREASERAQTAEAAARQADRAKSVMLANASHDLRTPLNAIIGFSELTLTEPYGAIGSERYRSYLRDIHASGNLLLAIVNDVLDLSKIEAGRYDMVEEPVDLGALSASVLNLIRSEAVKRQIELECLVPPIEVYADKRSIQQVLLNLVSNAVKFTQPGGRVTLWCGLDAEGGLVFEVRDTGKGIAEADQKLLFRPFSRGASSSIANTQGTGLGLAIVKGLVELHQGSASLSSRLGEGTTVRLWFPAARVLGQHPAAA